MSGTARLLYLPILLSLMFCAVAPAQFTTSTANGQVTITGYTGSGGAVSIPCAINGLPVTAIGSDAFASGTSITSVKIPNSVTGIGSDAFSGCTSLAAVTIPNGVIGIGSD